MTNPYEWIKHNSYGYYIARPTYLHQDGTWNSSTGGAAGGGYFQTKREAEQVLQHWLRTKPSAVTIRKILENLAWHQEQLKRCQLQRMCLEPFGLSHVFEDREDGLFNCLVCGGAEGSLSFECPGIRIDGDQLDRIYACQIDFRRGQWEPDSSRADRYLQRFGFDYPEE